MALSLCPRLEPHGCWRHYGTARSRVPQESAAAAPVPGGRSLLHPLLGRHAIPNALALGKSTRRRRPKNGQTLIAKLNARTLILPNFPHAGSRSWFSHGIPAPKRHPPIRNAKGVAGRDKTSRQDLEIACAGIPAPFRVLDSAPLSGDLAAALTRFATCEIFAIAPAAHAMAIRQ